jgi:chemotaxis protein methyltransferase CheR
MNPDDYKFLSDLLHKSSGLSLGDGKEYLLTSRLNPVAASLGLTDLDGLIRRLRFKPEPNLVQTVTEAMTTNESLFFRDSKPFDNLRDHIFPELMDIRKDIKRLRIWCAACSTGQEPFSIAMLMKASVPELANWQIEIIGTDISKEALARAEAGRFTQFEIQRGLPVQMLVRFFKQEDRDWVIDPEIRKMITFKEFNLLGPFSSLGQFDLVFCRNVLIYFDTDTKSQVLNKIANILIPQGYLFLGSAETILGISQDFERTGKEIAGYRRCARAPLASAS